MTIFLTTQYLEEADELCGRVGIIDRGRIVAEGSPDELKRSVGADIIIARVDGDAGIGARRHRSPPGRADASKHTATSWSSPPTTDRRRSARSRSRSTGATSPCATSPCARRRSTTCSSNTPAATSNRRPRQGARPMTITDVVAVDHHAPTRYGRGPPASSTTSTAIAGPGAARRAPRPRGGEPTGVHRAVLLRREHRDLVEVDPLRRTGLRLQGVPDAHRDPPRRHRRLPRARARPRHPERLLRPAVDDARPPPRDPARPHGRRRRGRDGADDAGARARLRDRRALRDRRGRPRRVHRVWPRSGASRSPASATRSRSRPGTRPR